MTKTPGRVRIAAVADLHFGRAGTGPPLRTLFADVVEQADVLVLCGDLTDTGEPEEAQALARELSPATIPTVAVLGNHDYESGKVPEVTRDPLRCGRPRARRRQRRGARGRGSPGVKGFAGGFGRRRARALGRGGRSRRSCRRR